MQKRSKVILAGAAMAALPALSQAATTLTLSIDPSAFEYSTTGAQGSFSSTVPAGYTASYASGTLTISDGSTGAPLYFEFGLNGNLTTATDSNGLTSRALSDFYVGLNNSSPSVAQMDPGGNPAAGSNILNSNDTPLFATVLGNNSTSQGNVASDGNGGISLTYGGLGGASTITTGSTGSKVTFDANTTTDLVKQIEVDTSLNSGASNKSTTFSILPDPGATIYVYGTTGAYHAEAFTSDPQTSIVVPSLNVVIQGSGGGGHSIISLVNSTAGLSSNYGSQVGSNLAVSGSNGSYVPAYTTFNAATTGYVTASGFSPLGDTEVYALKLSSLGTATSDATVVSDINASETGVTASLVAGSSYATEFSGYDILLTSSGFTAGGTAGSGSISDLGFDFTQDTTHPGITVSAVAAVPEPATAAGVVLGAAGLLLGRRRNKLVVA